MPRFSVPVIIETTNIFEVEARNGYDAAAKVGALQATNVPPTHSHETKRTMGKILPTVEGAKLDKVAGSAEHQTNDTAAASKPPRQS